MSTEKVKTRYTEEELMIRLKVFIGTCLSITLIGIILLLVATFLFYLTTDFSVEQLKLSHMMGIMAGIGLGLIFGGMVGYVSKGSAIKEEQKRREFKQLQKDKLELEKKAADFEKQKREAEINEQEKKQNF